MSNINTVGVVGAGLMGSGIAQVVAQSGYSVVVREVEFPFKRKGRNRERPLWLPLNAAERAGRSLHAYRRYYHFT